MDATSRHGAHFPGPETNFRQRRLLLTRSVARSRIIACSGQEHDSSLRQFICGVVPLGIRGHRFNGVAVQSAAALFGLVAFGVALIPNAAHRTDGAPAGVEAVSEHPEPGSLPAGPRAVGGTIAFTHHDSVSGLNGVYVTDGGEPRLVASGKEHVYLSVEWVQGGRRLVYTAGPPGEASSLWIAAADGSDATPLADGAAGSVSGVVVAPDGVQVAFARTYDNGSTTISVMDVASGVEQVLEASREAVVTPSFACDGLTPVAARPHDWSADGKELLISYSVIGCEVEFNASSIITMDTGRARSPAASDASDGSLAPQDGQAVYEAEGEIVVTDAEGAVSSLGQGEDPDISNQHDLAFVAARSWEDVETYGIWVSLDDTKKSAEPLVEPKVRVTEPKWSPTGSHIAFLAHDEAGVELWAVSVGQRQAGQLLGPVSGFVLDFAYAPRGASS